MKVVLDTNVLVSAILKPKSPPARILHLIIQGDIELVVNQAIFTEYTEVLSRPKFQLEPKDIAPILDFIRERAIRAPSLPQSFHLPDEDDEPFLEACAAVGADALLTGNKRHFPAEACKGQSVLTPREFLEAIEDVMG